MTPVRIAVVSSHPVQYSAPLYAYLNRDPALDITALYCSDYSLRGAQDPGFGLAVKWDVDLLSGYRAVFLGHRACQRSISGFWSLIVPELWGEIRSGEYDAVWLHGYGYAAYVLAFLAAKSKGLPVFMRSETHLALARPEWKRRLRDGVLSRAYRFVDRFLAIGTANHDYYRALGVPEDRIHLVPYTVDNERFIAAARLDPTERSALRAEMGISDDLPLLLFASKLMPRKHPQCVLQAAALLRERGVQVAVLMVGAGEMEPELRAMVVTLELENVTFAGFVNQSELPRVYATADVFVLPSTNEPWGFIVNEVMCAALPVVVSEEVGCVSDLVHAGRNGRCMDGGDPVSLAAILEDLLGGPAHADKRERLRAMGRESLSIIRGWDYERCRVGLCEAVDAMRETGDA